MNLSESEQTIFDMLKCGDHIPLELIQSAMQTDTRHAAIVRMKYLSAKLAPEGWIIENNSGVGRGKKAVYSMSKKFS